MKANKHLFMRKDTSAQVGIGTLIIFIAMVLVAAVAAAVLIQTSGVLQQKAQTTGKQTTQEISSNIQVKSVEGLRANNVSGANLSSTVDLLKLKIGLNVGSSDVDMNQIVVTITDGSSTNDLVYANNEKLYGTAMIDFSSSSPSTNLKTMIESKTGSNNNAGIFFTLEKIRDEDESFSQSEPVMNTGDLVTMYIGTASSLANTSEYTDLYTVSPVIIDSGLNLVPRTEVQILLTPEAGATTTADFVTPSTYGVKETVSLYP